MRKIIPSILITLIIANIFAPFSVGINKGNVALKPNIAEAGDIKITLSKKTTQNSISLRFQVARFKETQNHGMFYFITDKPGVKFTLEAENDPRNAIAFIHLQQANENSIKRAFILPDNTTIIKSDYYSIGGQDIQIKEFTLTESDGIKPDTNYYVTYGGYNGTQNDAFMLETDSEIMLNNTGQNDNEFKDVSSGSGGGYLPACVWGLIHVSIGGCFAQGLYYLLFEPTAAIFAMAGKFFDFTFSFSIKDSSYRSSFVIGGWGVVRDFVNMFFIFILLYIAISTILNTHGFKTKEMIVNVVIIGLLINFSLFATQVIIDASNILARVFYDQISISETKKIDRVDTKVDGKTTKVGNHESKPLSAKVVSFANPQRIISEANQAKVSVKSVNNETQGSGLNNATFILVTLLATAVNVVGIIVFLSVGFMLISRVLGLWLAMIFAPFAFFSYTVPAMQGWEFVGWKHWWSDTLKLAFLAPVFMFFMYLILQFLSIKDMFGLGDPATSNTTGPEWIILILFPFAFIMVLMMQAKSIAKTMSGKLGQSITSGVTAIGGLALGGAALGAAFAGRNIVGRGMAAMSNSSGAKKLDTYHQQLKDFNAGNGPHPGAKPKVGVIGKIGHRLNRSQRKIGEVDHAKHEVDDIKKKAGLEGVSNSNLSAADKEKIQKMFTKEKRSEIESDLRSGKADLVDRNGNNLGKIGESGYKASRRNDLITDMHNNADPNDVDTYTGELTDAGKKKIEDQLNGEFNAILRVSVEKESEKKFTHLQDEAKSFVSAPERIFAGSNKASYDARNLSNIKSDGRGGFISLSWLTKAGVALTAAAAMLMRTSLKQSGVSHGTGQGDFFKDLKNVFEEGIKNAKINVKVESGGGGHGGGHDDHAGGHGGGHH